MPDRPRIEVQRYIDPPPGRLRWRSYMAHVELGQRDWWLSVSIPTGLA